MYIPNFRDVFLRESLKLRQRFTNKLIIDAIEAGITQPPEKLFDLINDMVIAKQEPPVDKAAAVYARLLSESAQQTLSFYGNKYAVLNDRLDVQSPYVHQTALTLSGNLIRQINEQTKESVRRIIYESIRDGVPPRQSANLIRGIVGLTSRQSGSVMNLWRTMADAGNPNAELNAMRYGEKLLRDRAVNIARTETMFSANKGQQLAWREMVNSQLIDTTRFQQKWMVTPDDRLCDRCAPMDNKLVPLDGHFEETERGVLPSARISVAGTTVENPPLHPQCRCTLVADFTEKDVVS